LALFTWLFFPGSWLLATCPAKRELLARISNQKKLIFFVNSIPLFIFHFSFFFFHHLALFTLRQAPFGRLRASQGIAFYLALFTWLFFPGSWLLALSFWLASAIKKTHLLCKQHPTLHFSFFIFLFSPLGSSSPALGS
jgi:hypothetical protein